MSIPIYPFVGFASAVSGGDWPLCSCGDDDPANCDATMPLRIGRASTSNSFTIDSTKPVTPAVSAATRALPAMVSRFGSASREGCSSSAGCSPLAACSNDSNSARRCLICSPIHGIGLAAPTAKPAIKPDPRDISGCARTQIFGLAACERYATASRRVPVIASAASRAC